MVKDMDKISRKERDDIRKRQEILNTAMSIFAAQGFHGTTMAQISQNSQYPLGTIYKYFTSKKQIYHDLVMGKAHELAHILRAITTKEDLNPLEQLEESLFAQTDFYRTNREFIRIYISERSNIDAVMMPQLNQKINRMHERRVTLFQGIFEKGITQGLFKPYPAQEMAVMFSDISHSASWSSLFRDEGEELLKQKLHMVFEMFTQGVFHDLGQNELSQ